MGAIWKRLSIIIATAAMFFIGLVGTVYLSLRSSEVRVPNIVGRSRWDGEAELERIGLKMRVRVTRPSLKVGPDTILDQSPRAGEVIKVGQTIAVVVSRAPIGGEVEALQESEKAAQEAAAQPTPMLENANRNERRRVENKNANHNANVNGNLNVNANANHNLNANIGVNTNVGANLNLNQNRRLPSNANNANAGARMNTNANHNVNRARTTTNVNRPHMPAERQP